MKKSRLLLSIFFILTLVISGCTTYTIHDERVRVHFINEGKKAPFSGVLLNNYTYQSLKKCCERNENGRNKN